MGQKVRETAHFTLCVGKYLQNTPVKLAPLVSYLFQTGYSVSGRFLQYWHEHGELAQQGYPITNMVQEVSPSNGKTYAVQYFERAVFEWHQRNVDSSSAGAPYDVILSQLGTLRLIARGVDRLVAPPQPGNGVQFQVAGSDRYLVWTEGVEGPTESGANPQQDTLDIRALDLKSGLAFAVATAAGEQSNPAIDGSTVVWLDNNYSGCDTPPCNNSVRGKSLPDGPEFTVATGSIVNYTPGVANGKVSWVESEGSTTKLLLKDLSSNTPVTVATGPVENPRLSSEYLTWLETSPKSGPDGLPPFYMLRTYSVKTGQVKTVAQGPLAGHTQPPLFALSGHYLVWQAPELRLLDLNSGAETILTNDQTGILYIKDQTVLWTAWDGIWGLKLSDRKPLLLKPVYGGVFNETAIAGDWLVGVSYIDTMDSDRLDKLFANPSTPTPRPIEPPPPLPTQPPAVPPNTATPPQLAGARLPGLAGINHLPYAVAAIFSSRWERFTAEAQRTQRVR